MRQSEVGESLLFLSACDMTYDKYGRFEVSPRLKDESEQVKWKYTKVHTPTEPMERPRRPQRFFFDPLPTFGSMSLEEHKFHLIEC